MYQSIIDCEYDGNLMDVVFLVKNVFNQQLNNIYDSRVGKYIGFGEYGMVNAAHYNSVGWKMAERKASVETICKYNARHFRKSTLDRKGMLPLSVTSKIPTPEKAKESVKQDNALALANCDGSLAKFGSVVQRFLLFPLIFLIT